MKKKLEQLQTDKAKNEKEYAEWQASCEAWKKSHANHPNKELFNKYNEEVLIFYGHIKGMNINIFLDFRGKMIFIYQCPRS